MKSVSTSLASLGHTSCPNCEIIVPECGNTKNSSMLTGKANYPYLISSADEARQNLSSKIKVAPYGFVQL